MCETFYLDLSVIQGIFFSIVVWIRSTVRCLIDRTNRTQSCKRALQMSSNDFATFTEKKIMLKTYIWRRSVRTEQERCDRCPFCYFAHKTGDGSIWHVAYTPMFNITSVWLGKNMHIVGEQHGFTKSLMIMYVNIGRCIKSTDKQKNIEYEFAFLIITCMLITIVLNVISKVCMTMYFFQGWHFFLFTTQHTLELSIVM